MNTIDQDTIDFAGDFFFKLSDGQLKERVEDMKIRQGEIHLMIDGINQQFHRQDNKDLLWKLCLIIDYSFISVFGKLPVIQKKAIIDYFTWMKKVAYQHASPAGDVDHDFYLFHVEQNELMIFVAEKINDFFLEKILDDGRANKFLMTVVAVGDIYQQEAKKLPSIEN